MSEQLKNNYSVRSDVKEHPSADFSLLREKAISYAQEASGSFWTDYNVHDPGVTILEAFCYTITEIAYKMSLDLNQLLLHSASGSKVYPNQLLQHANELLPPKATTLEDYSILMQDVLINEITHVYIDANIQDTNGIKGLYTISVIARNELSIKQEQNLKYKIAKLFLRHRNIGEDLKKVRILKAKKLSIECNIVLSNTVDAHECIAEFFFELNQILNPTPSNFSLNELLEKGLDYDKIFDCASFLNGFIDSTSIPKKQKSLQLSRIKQLLARQKGVRAIDGFYVLIDGILQREDWYSIDENCYIDVELANDNADYFTKINVQQTNEVIEIDYNRVFHLYNTFVQEKFAKNVHIFVNPTYPPQSTTTKNDLLNYKSIVYDLPSIYRVGSYEAAINEDVGIQASSKQLTDYLSFFDDILESYLKHLTKLEHLFSVNEVEQKADNLADYIYDAQFQIYQHLLARLGEFDYSFEKSGITTEIKKQQKEKLGNIIRFIQNNNRFELAGQYYLGDEVNNQVKAFPLKAKLAHICGLQVTEITSLTAVFDKNLEELNVEELSTKKDEQESNTDNKEITIEAENSIVFDSPTKEVWKFLLANVTDETKYVIKKKSGKYVLTFKKDEYLKEQTVSTNASKKELTIQLANFLSRLEQINNESEGFHLVEHILLRPRETTKVHFSLLRDSEVQFQSIKQGTYEHQYALAKDTALLAAYKNNYRIVDLKNSEFGVVIKDLAGVALAESNKRFISKTGADDFIKEMVVYFEQIKNDDKLTDVLSISSPKNYHLSILNKLGDTMFKTVDAQSIDRLNEIQESVLNVLKLSDSYEVIQKKANNYIVKIVIDSIAFESIESFSSEEFAQNFIEKSLKIYRGIRIIHDPSIFFNIHSIYARNSSIYNYTVTLLYPDWPTKFQNEQFLNNFLQTVYQELPSYIKLVVKPLSLSKMRVFEEVYFPWLALLSDLDENNNEKLNLLSSKMLDILNG